MTDCAVADRDGAGFGQSNGRFSYDYGADKHHGAVRQLITGGLQVRAIRLDLHTQRYTPMRFMSFLGTLLYLGVG